MRRRLADEIGRTACAVVGARTSDITAARALARLRIALRARDALGGLGATAGNTETVGAADRGRRFAVSVGQAVDGAEERRRIARGERQRAESDGAERYGACYLTQAALAVRARAAQGESPWRSASAS